MTKKIIVTMCILVLFTSVSYCKTVKTIGVFYGDSKNLYITNYDINRVAKSLTGYLLKFRLCTSEANYYAGTYLLNLSFTNSATTGVATLDLTIANMSQKTGAYYLFIDKVNAGGTYKKTINQYMFVIMPPPKSMNTLEVYYGDSKSFSITNWDENHDEKALTGFTLNFRLCKNQDDYRSANYTLDLPFTNYTQSGTTLGQAYINLTIANMTQTVGTYYLFIDKTNAGGTVKKTTNEYTFKILPGGN